MSRTHGTAHGGPSSNLFQSKWREWDNLNLIKSSEYPFRMIGFNDIYALKVAGEKQISCNGRRSLESLNGSYTTYK